MNKKTFKTFIKHLKSQYKEAMNMIESQADFENRHYNFEISKAFYCGKISAYKDIEEKLTKYYKGN